MEEIFQKYIKHKPVINNETDIMFLISDYENKIISNVNKVYNRLYFVPQLGMFHSEILMLITLNIYKNNCTCTLPVKSVDTTAHTVLFLTILKINENINIGTMK